MRVVSMGGTHSQSVKPVSIARVFGDVGFASIGQYHGVNMSESLSVKPGIPASALFPRIGSGAREKPPTDVAVSRRDGKAAFRG